LKTGEKPDAKLMSLLKAARGAVIEDLTVDWGISEAEKGPGEEDFELVSGPSGSGHPTPQSGLPPISLFDERTPPTETTEIGPKRTIVHLPPPPVIQQAPKSDKLPIPLYPGFRCSIFAIIKQASNPGPPSTTVRITGKVMGREVTFQTSVVPRGIGSNEASGVIDSGKLLHTLAAKALIQVYEDMPTSPENKAQIERLGKRYSLASSVTSFLAIDEESRREVQYIVTSIRHDDYHEQRRDLSMAPSFAPYAPAVISISSPSSPQTIRVPSPQSMAPSLAPSARTVISLGSPLRSQTIRVSSPAVAAIPRSRASSSSQVPHSAIRRHACFNESYDPTPYEEDDPTLSYGQEEYRSPRRSRRTTRPDTYDPTIEDEFYTQDEYRTMPRRHDQLVGSQVSSQGVGALDATERGGSVPSPFSRVLSFVKRTKRSSTSSFPDLQGSGPSRASSSSYSIAGATVSSLNSYQPPAQTVNPLASSQSARSPDLPSVSRRRVSLGSAALNLRANSAGPVTLESIVRAQQFNGSFPNDQAFLAQICGNKPAPSMPAALRDAKGKGRTESVKLEIWATVLVLVCLRRNFAAERDSWEIIAEKAMVFVKYALGGIGVGNTGPFRDTLIADAEGLF
jgi:hypothetical protein